MKLAAMKCKATVTLISLNIHDVKFLQYSYSLMHQCWLHKPEGRPTFIQLVNSLSVILEGLAGYLDVGAFGRRTSVVPESPGYEKLASATFIEKPDDNMLTETHL